ncbi:MAG: class I SAM-dependent RNA methyltransferase [Sneathiellales bacterium]|nr:class I SAM-dependent RNA methyltransferase [Sneathiellales bacterium]
MLELTIDHVGAQGDGVGFKDGQTYYVPFTAAGDVVIAEAGEKRGNGQTASLKEIIQPSADRQKPECRHFGTCGGCNLQHLIPASLSNWKREKLKSILKKEGIETVKINPVEVSPAYSRRRVEFVASKRKKGVMIGYHVRKSHQVFDVGECPLIHPDLISLVKPLRQMLSSFLPRNSKARLTLTHTLGGPDLLITCAVTPDLEQREILAEFASQNSLSRISCYHEEERLLEVISERKEPLIPVEEHTVSLPPGGFLQATMEGQDKLIELMMQALPKNASILDLFAGCGSFTLPASKNAKSLLAIEGDEDLTKALQTASNAQMLNISTDYRDLFRRPLLPEELERFDTVIIDPPRAGAKAQVEELARSTIKKIIFISCNPASFARDARTLIDAGFSMSEITPVDQFLWSPHIELFTVFEKQSMA